MRTIYKHNEVGLAIVDYESLRTNSTIVLLSHVL
jgi:hypothetical protein